MLLHCALTGVLSAAAWCLDKDLEVCSIPGVLPPPELFLNVSSAQVGDFVSARCKTPPDISSMKIFFCKDGHPISAQKEVPHNLVYTFSFSITKQNAGQYSCGYQKMYANNQKENSILSASWNLSVMLDQFSEEEKAPTMNAIPLYVWILRSTMVLLLLVSSYIFSCILEKCC